MKPVQYFKKKLFCGILHLTVIFVRILLQIQVIFRFIIVINFVSTASVFTNVNLLPLYYQRSHRSVQNDRSRFKKITIPTVSILAENMYPSGENSSTNATQLRNLKQPEAKLRNELNTRLAYMKLLCLTETIYSYGKQL